MFQNNDKHLYYLCGIFGIGVFLFIPGVIIQLPITGWFPEEALQSGSMLDWLNNLITTSNLALFGIALSILAILCFMGFAVPLYKIFPKDSWHSTAGYAIHLLGITLALAAFTFAFGFTISLSYLTKIATQNDFNHLNALANLSMQGFLFCDELATFLLAVANTIYSVKALKSNILPKWICRWGFVTMVLICFAPFKYMSSIFEIAQIAYPMIILWFVFSGIYLLNQAKKAE